MWMIFSVYWRPIKFNIPFGIALFKTGVAVLLGAFQRFFLPKKKVLPKKYAKLNDAFQFCIFFVP